jgi:hypothetical protein
MLQSSVESGFNRLLLRMDQCSQMHSGNQSFYTCFPVLLHGYGKIAVL